MWPSWLKNWLTQAAKDTPASPAVAVPQDALQIPPVPSSDDAAARFARCVAIVLKHEGGFVNHPKDPGGATNRGITKATLEDWRGKPLSVEDVRSLTELEARQIYRARYWNAIHGDNLPAGVDLAVFDFAVNSGVGRAAKFLQSALAVTQDGAIGPQTLAAVKRANPARLADTICDTRAAWLRGLATFSTFGRGWLARVADVSAEATAMTKGSA